MKKNKMLGVLLGVTALAALAGCDNDSKPEPKPTVPPVVNPTPDKPADQKKDFNVALANKEFVYDGTEKSLELSGDIPTGAKVEYTGNKEVNAGEYTVKAKISMDGYNTKELSAKLTITKADYKGISFADSEIVYDGEDHTLLIEGTLPEGTEVKYTCGDSTQVSYSDAGEYNITVALKNKNYNDLTMTKKLTIKKADFTGIVFEDAKVEFDNNPHKLEFTGNLPEGSKVAYTSNVSGMSNEFTNPGEYEITLTITNKNFNDYKATKKLTIVSKAEDLYSIYDNGNLYFQNALDKDRLYSYASDGTLTRISGDKSQYFTAFDNNIYFRSDSLVQPTISKLNTAINKTEIAAVANGTNLVSDGEYIYYIGHEMLSSTGIYRMKYGTDGEPVIECVFTGKVKNLAVVGDKLYFSNGANKNYLSWINKATLNQTSATPLIENKINNLYEHNGVLYFTVNELLGDYIMKYTPATNSLVKLTSDAAGSMVVLGDYLYYTNVDKLNTLSFGKGIYRVKHNTTGNSDMKGEAVLKDANKDYELTSLQTDGSVLYFYRVFDKGIYSYNPKTSEYKNLLEGFRAPEEKALFQSGKAIEYGGNIYYQNIYDGDKLYKYEPATGNQIRLTSAPVDDMYVYNDYLYYRQISYLVNKDLYRMNLKVSEEPTLISTNDCGELEIMNDRIYYVNYSGSNTLNSMSLDGSDDKVIYNKEVYNIRAYQGKLYFIQNGALGDYIYSLDVTDPSATPVKYEDCKTTCFEIHFNEIYFRKIFKVNKCLAKVNLDGTGYTEVYNNNCDPESIVFHGDKLYYYNDVSSNYGIFELNLNTMEAKKLVNEYASNLLYNDGYIYYYNYTSGVFGNSHFFRLKLSDNSLERLA